MEVCSAFISRGIYIAGPCINPSENEISKNKTGVRVPVGGGGENHHLSKSQRITSPWLGQIANSALIGRNRVGKGRGKIHTCSKLLAKTGVYLQ